MTDQSRDLARTMLQAAFIGVLVAGCSWILRPFLLPMIWATAIAVATWPLMLRLQRYLGGRRSLAVTLMTLALLLVLLVPLAFGIIGLFIGPVFLAVGTTLLAAWVTEGQAETEPTDAGATRKSEERP